jgi:hypothetical protein
MEWIPYRTSFPILAIDVPNEGENVTQASIDKYHGIFINELDELFNRHKHEAGYGDRQLKIVWDGDRGVMHSRV